MITLKTYMCIKSWPTSWPAIIEGNIYEEDKPNRIINEHDNATAVKGSIDLTLKHLQEIE